MQSQDAESGVVPFENSANGSVDTTLDCLVDRVDRFTSVTAIGEAFVEVQHCLLGLHSSADGGGLQDVTDVYSHPQAFGQCHDFIMKHLKHAELHETASTSEAAHVVAAGKCPTAVAISSQLAAEKYHLLVRRHGIQDQNDNQTRFLILRNNFPPPETLITDKPWSQMILLAFSIDHERPGALADALDVFKRHRLNLTSLNSRPSRQTAWHYLFLVELECHGSPEQVATNIDSAFRELPSMTTKYEKKGSWIREKKA